MPSRKKRSLLCLLSLMRLKESRLKNNKQNRSGLRCPAAGGLEARLVF
jgi:hypothetical protein